MIELLLIRHGETAWNAERRLQGHLNIPLNDAGLQQAQALALALKNESLDAIICSDLQRAMQTAQAIAQYQNQQCIIEPAWRERCFGGFEGELISQIEQRFPAEYAAWRAYEIDMQFPANAQGEFNGESIRQFHTRIEQVLLELSQRFQHGKIVVVAHGGVLECAYRIAHQLALDAPRQVSMLNASINRFELSSDQDSVKLKMLQGGDVAHLELALDELNA
ncbi:histidine phosphatase family protein [Solimicrobium silvestre]|uniref:Fructose-26-bisphosphatase n=1 Tax=Solimicrobium silvestre TaxID=2099400 RepID=A0A2S9GV24_9BURK|nr:histidine phosphatase family protein [Solimicrobium silvestre]PRC91569.1 Fructose-26-bisphosphatase [Solimicrobium silvestre]